MQTLDKAFRSDPASPPPPEEAPRQRQQQRNAAKRWAHRRRLVKQIFMLAVLITTIGLYIWAQRTGRMDVWALQIGQASQAYLARSGFGAHQIIITGQQRTPLDQIYRALGQRDGAALTTLNPHELVPRLAELPWIADVSVQRIWPNTLDIRIAEKRPMAVLHHPNGYTAIDANGALIAPADQGLVSSLPNIAGPGAAAAAQGLLVDLAAFPQIRDRFIGATRISERRWNLYLAPGLEIRLPERGVAQALQTLQDMNRFNQIFDKDVQAIDLRTSRPFILQ